MNETRSLRELREAGAEVTRLERGEAGGPGYLARLDGDYGQQGGFFYGMGNGDAVTLTEIRGELYVAFRECLPEGK